MEIKVAEIKVYKKQRNLINANFKTSRFNFNLL